MAADKKHSLLKKAVYAGLFSGALFTSLSFPFFHFIMYAGKSNGNKPQKSRKQWFQLHHTRINHPRDKFEEEYLSSREWCERQTMHDVYTESFDGLKLHGMFFPADKPERIVILCHGYRGTCFGSIAHIAKHLHENNTSMLFIDQRCCGKSEGSYITFGAKEQYDILAWTELIHEMNEQGLPVYLYGQSMGASAALMASGHTFPDDVKGMILDCGFHSMKQQLRDIALYWFHFRWIGLLLIRIDILCRIFAGFTMKEADTAYALEHNKLPILFFHGSKDTYVFPENTELNYRICTAPKEKVVVPDARHLCCSYTAPEIYKNKIMEFFEKYDHGNQ